MPVITGICTKWLKNSQQNPPLLELPPPQAGGKKKESNSSQCQRCTITNSSPQRLNSSQGGKTVHTQVRSPSFPLSTSVPLMGSAERDTQTMSRLQNSPTGNTAEGELCISVTTIKSQAIQILALNCQVSSAGKLLLCACTKKTMHLSTNTQTHMSNP